MDNVGNVEAEQSLAIQSDATPPLTQLLISAPSVAAASSTVVGPGTALSLSAQDPLSSGVASQVSDTFVSVSTGAFAPAPADFALSGEDGPRVISFYSRDNVLNEEPVKRATVLLDATPPASTVMIGAPLFIAADAVRYVTPATPVALTAADPVVNGVASGLDRVEVSVDGAPFAAYVSTLTFAEGAHTLLYRALDRVGNVEATLTLRLRSDNTMPVTALEPSGAYFAEGGRDFAPLSFAYTLPAQDPVASGVASGVAATVLRVDEGPLTRYASPFGLSEGVRRVDFQSADNVGNQELLKSATVYVDAAPPVTALSIGSPRYASPGGTLFVGPAAPFTLASQDPVTQGVASGVKVISARLDQGPYSFYSTTFTLTPGDGLRTVGWFAADNVGNAETPQVSTAALDETSPLTTLLVSGGRQFAGPDAATFYASSDMRLILIATDPAVNGVASGVAFTRWQDNGGAFETYLSSLTLAEGAHKLGYQSADNVTNLEVLRSTTVLVDATAPVTTASIGSPRFTALDATIYVTPSAPIAFSAADPLLPTGQAGSGLHHIETSLDGAPFAPFGAALYLPEGRHVILFRAVDNVGNVETSRSLDIQSDATPPLSALSIGSPQFALSASTLLVSSRTTFSLTAVDPPVRGAASGVKDSFWRVLDLLPSTATFQAYAAPFSLSGSDAVKVIEFYSRDNVLNAETPKSAAVLLDSTPPEAVLLSPTSCDAGICRVVRGRFPVLGTARDLHFASYTLEAAPGKDAAAGFAFISSGTVALSSAALGVWDTGALSGWQTLRLTGTDQVQNAASSALNVFVGDPATLLVLGGHETFNMPEGVAVGTDGKIYVADRDNNRVAVFSSTGAFLASFGGRERDEDDDHPRSSTATLRLKQPSAVAVDGAGSIYVADTGHHRLLKLSPAGAVLLDLGRRKVEREDDDDDKEKAERNAQFKAGAGPGEFKKPAGVAVGSDGRIYVSDTNNHRVQVFSSTGVFALAFAMPPLPPSPEDDETEPKDNDDESPELGKPVGIALDSAANIYVADSKGRRALAFDPAGRLLLTVPVSGGKPGKSARPVGIAVAPSGNCLLVSDQQSGRIVKYDFQGNLNLSFGGKEREDGGRRRASSIKLRKPSGLAMDAAGALYVADRNNEFIKKFSLPDGSATVIMPPQGPDEDHNIAREVIDREDGGRVERKDRAAVSIPPDALPEDLRISVTTPTAAVAAESRRGADDKNMKVASPPVEYQPHGTQFEKPVTLTIPYNPELLAAQNAGDAGLKVHYWNPKKKTWEELDSTVDKQSRVVRAKTTHFSLYQVFTGTAAAAEFSPLAADASFGLKAAYAFPNPARGVGSATIRVQPGRADSLQVNVYDVAGRKVHSSSNFRNLGAFDDGNGLGAQFTYEHIWDLSGVGSGVYAYIITAYKAGERDIHRSGKLGVIK